MGHSSMTICVLVALALSKLICGHPAINDSGSILSMLKSHVSKSDAFSEPKAISSVIKQENLSIMTMSRQRRLSDQRLAELETLMALSKLCPPSLAATGRRLDPKEIGRRRRFAVDQIPTELAPIKAKYIRNSANPLVS